MPYTLAVAPPLLVEIRFSFPVLRYLVLFSELTGAVTVSSELAHTHNTQGMPQVSVY